MLNGIIEAFFEIIKLIWNAPFWLVVVVVIIFSILYFIGMIFGFFDEDSSDSAQYGVDSSYTYTNETYQIEFDKVEHPFVFYDYNGDHCSRGDSFYDSEGYYRSWGEGFYDGKGYYRNWGDSYYDAHGYFRSWGNCFYDTQGNLVYPNE